MKFKFIMPCLLGFSLLSACSGASPGGSSLPSASLRTQGTSAVSLASSSSSGNLASGSQINAGDSIFLYTQIHNVFQLTLGTDGNLTLSILQRNSVNPSLVLWATNTKSGRFLRMQTDGNLVLYDGQNKALWATGTAGSSGSVMTMLPDGSLAVEKSGVPIWSSDSVRYVNLAAPSQLVTSPNVNNVNGQSWVGSPSSWTQLTISSGNLILSTNPSHSGDISQWKVLWSTHTSTGSTLRMQSDGNLVLYDVLGKALWDSGTWRFPGTFLSIEENGTMVLSACGARGSGYLNVTGVSGCPIGKTYPVWTFNP